MTARMMRTPVKNSLIAALSILAVCNIVASADEPAATGRSAALPYYNRANRYLNQGRYDDAMHDLQEAIKLFPDEPDFHTNLGIAFRKLNRYVDAEQEFKIAIAYNRDDWMNWSNLANAYLKQDKLEKTVETFEETLKHKPPADEQAAIKKDIADIQKILAMRQGSSEKPASGQKTAAGTAGKGSPAKQPKTLKTQTTQKSTMTTQQPVVNHGDEIPLVPSTPSKVSSQTATSSESSAPHAKTGEKKSDWGYDAK
jgi:tetratricopeptide (TPR) repeat protein